MKKDEQHHHMNENAETVLWAAGFLGFIMLLSYLYWFA